MAGGTEESGKGDKGVSEFSVKGFVRASGIVGVIIAVTVVATLWPQVVGVVVLALVFGVLWYALSCDP